MRPVARWGGGGRVSASYAPDSYGELVENIDSSTVSVAATYLSASEQSAFSTPSTSSLQGITDHHIPTAAIDYTSEPLRANTPDIMDTSTPDTLTTETPPFIWETTSSRGYRYLESINWWECVRCTLANPHNTNTCGLCGQIRGGGSAITRSVSRRINAAIDNETPLPANIDNTYNNGNVDVNTIHENSHNEKWDDELVEIPPSTSSNTSSSGSISSRVKSKSRSKRQRCDVVPDNTSTNRLHLQKKSNKNDEMRQEERNMTDLLNEEESNIMRFQDHQQTSSSSRLDWSVRNNDERHTQPQTQQLRYARWPRVNPAWAQIEEVTSHITRSRGVEYSLSPTALREVNEDRITNREVIVISSDSSDSEIQEQLQAVSKTDQSKGKAILDSGASTTTFREKRMFRYLRPVQLTINTASKKADLVCKYSGPVGVFKEAFWIPELNSDLISLGALDALGIKIQIEDGQMTGTYNSKVLFNITKKHNIWQINTDYLLSILDTSVAMDVPNMWWATPFGIEEKKETKKFQNVVNRLWLWHKRLYHASVRRIIEGLNKGVLNLGDTELATQLKEVVIDLQRFKTEKCSSCAKSKSSAQPRPRRVIPTASIPAKSVNKRAPNLDYDENTSSAQGFIQGYIATDMCGPFTTRSLKGSFVGIQTYVDMASKWSYPYFYRNKSDAIDNLKNLVNEQLKRDKIEMKHYHSDGADELCGAETRKYLSGLGIKTSWTSPSAPQENSIVERHFGTMMRGVVAMFENARFLPKGLWNFTVEAFCFIYNRLPTTTGKGWMSPHEYRYGKPADLSWLKVWGCKMFVNIPVDKRAKNFNPRAQVGYLVGYSEHQKHAYKVWIPSTNRIIISRDAIANEEIPSGDVDFSTDEYWREARQFTRFEQRGERNEEDYYYLVGLEFYDPEEDIRAVVTRIEVEGRSRHIVGYYKRIINDIVEEKEHQRMHVAEIEKLLGIYVNDDENHALALSSLDLVEQADHLSSTREASTISATDIEHEGLSARHDVNPERDITPILNSIELPELHGTTSYACALESAGIQPYEPTTYHEAMACEERENWKFAIQTEHENLRKKEVFKEVKIPTYPHRRIGSKYVFKVKMKNGVVEKYKVRIVAKGYNQILDLDYNESFAPVARFNTLRIFLTISLAKRHIRKSVDVVAAYLNSPLSEELYLETPDGMTCKPGYILKLERAIYGLKQAGRNWYLVLKGYLIEREGYTCCLSEHCVFRNEEMDMMLIVYVDDVIVSGKDEKEVDVFISRLKETFELSEPSELDWYLGIGIQECEEGIFLTQEKYIEKIAEKFGYEFRLDETLDTPMVENLSILKDPTDELFEDYEIKSRIGSLMFAAVCTRPDITYAISYLARYAVHPSKEVCRAIDRLFKYLVGTKELGIFIPRNDDLTLRVYCDSDYGGDKADYKSTSGVIAYLGKTTICWYSSKQTSTAQSSCDAEIVAMNFAAKEIVWLRGFLAELGCPQNKPTKLLCDNQGAIQLAHNPVFHKRTKHIMIKFSYLVEQLQNDEIVLIYVKSADNVSDIFTKAEKAVHFIANRKRMNMQISGK